MRTYPTNYMTSPFMHNIFITMLLSTGEGKRELQDFPFSCLPTAKNWRDNFPF